MPIDSAVGLWLASIAATCGVATAALLWALLGTRLGDALLDRPVHRSMHVTPTPKIGGVVLCPVVGLACAHYGVMVSTQLVVALALLWSVSLVDDMRSLTATTRLLCHAAGAALAVLALPPSNLALGLLAFMSIVWMSNVNNFMDGADGLAGGMAVVGFSAYAYAAITAADWNLAALCVAIASASLGFLWWNFAPARLFLGDSGSVPLGFLSGLVGYWGFLNQTWPFWFPALVFSPFILDATRTLVKRLLARRVPWQAHRDHLYQRLILSGWSHRRLALSAYVVMGLVSMGALVALSLPQQIQAVTVFIVLFALAVIFSVAERSIKPG